MRIFLRMPLPLVAVPLVLAISAFGTATTEKINVIIPYSFSDLIPCANQGAGEVVDFSGSLHQTLSITVNGNNINIHEASNPQGITGVGETTGDLWQATGVNRQDVNASVSTYPYEITIVSNFRLINGEEGSLLIHQNTHVTVNANGTTTASPTNSMITCK